jgi:hypothetical protein
MNLSTMGLDTTNKTTVLVAIITVLGVLVAFIYARHRGKLAKAQPNHINEEKNKTNISVRLLVSNRGVPNFVLENVGKVEAENIHFEFLADDEYSSCLDGYTNIGDNINKKLINILYPGEKGSIQVAINGGVRDCEVAYSWENPDGTRHPEQRHIVTPAC